MTDALKQPGGNSAARNAIFAKIKKSLTQQHAHAPDGGAGFEEARAARVAARLRERPRQAALSRVQVPRDDLLALFRGYLEGQAATVIDVDAAAAIPAAIADYLRANNMPAKLRMGDDPDLANLDWTTAANLERLSGAAAPDDAVGLSHAVAGAAETGTLFLASGAANPVTTYFMPETHIIVVRARDIFPSYEDAWDVIRASAMPRTVNMISGPSRTADIAATLVRGAHGPKELCVIILRDSD